MRGRWGKPPPPPIGVLFLSMHSIPHCKIPGCTNACIMRYPMYISLRPWVDKWGLRGGSPTPTPPGHWGSIDSCTCFWTSITRFLDMPMHACIRYAMYNYQPTIVGRRIRGWVHHAPPPPPTLVGFRFVHMHSNPISRFLAMPKHTCQLRYLYLV